MESDTDHPYDWSFIDAAYCISVRERQDRVRSAAAQFHRVGLCKNIKFYRPQRNADNSIVGIWESHRAILSHALKEGYRTVLVSENDVCFATWVTPQLAPPLTKAFRALPEN